MSATIETLQTELTESNTEAEKLTSELSALKLSSKAAERDSSSKDQVAALERRTRDLLDQCEKLRIDVESWESTAMTEKASREEAEEKLRRSELAQREAESKVEDLQAAVERESQTAREMQSVLEEFQSSQDSEFQRALIDYQEKYDRAAEGLEENKEKARKAEAKLKEYQDAAERCVTMEQDVKEKNLLIGKLRHEGGLPLLAPSMKA